MNKTIVLAFAAVIAVVLLGVWYWSEDEVGEVVATTPTSTPPIAVVKDTKIYRDVELGYSVTLPTIISLTTDENKYRIETLYAYEGKGPEESIMGVQFTIPSAMATGTNLSNDTYISIEHLEKGEECNAAAFLSVPDLASETLNDGVVTYSVASSSEAAAGNRYEEYVYALPDTDPCLAVRYFIHSTALENYDEGTVVAFNRTKLFADFDTIRKSLLVSEVVAP
jgi:hypothetical protein